MLNDPAINSDFSVSDKTAELMSVSLMNNGSLSSADFGVSNDYVIGDGTLIANSLTIEMESDVW